MHRQDMLDAENLDIVRRLTEIAYREGYLRGWFDHDDHEPYDSEGAYEASDIRTRVETAIRTFPKEH